MKRNQYKSYIAMGVTAFCVIAAAILLFFLIYHGGKVRAFFAVLARILRPIFMGMIFAFLLLPVHRHALKALVRITGGDKNGTRKHGGLLNGLAIVISLLFAFVLLYMLLAMVLPQLYLSVVGLINSIPDYIETVQGRLTVFLENNPEIRGTVVPMFNSAALSLEHWLSSDILPNLESVTSTIQWLRVSVLPNITGVVTGVSTLVMAVMVLVKDLMIAVIVSIYLLARKDTFAAQSKKIVYSIFPPRIGDLIVGETRNAYQILSGFINGKLLDSLIIGVIALVSCDLLNFPYAPLLATIIGVTNIIPFFGPFIGAVPCALLILLVSPLQCLYFIAFIVILQQFDGNILGPKILGNSTGLASFWVLFSILLFGGLFGFAGMVLGVPVFAMAYSILRRLVNRGLRRHGLPWKTEEYMGQTGPMAQTAPTEASESQE